jgi:hypothetical protein
MKQVLCSDQVSPVTDVQAGYQLLHALFLDRACDAQYSMSMHAAPPCCQSSNLCATTKRCWCLLGKYAVWLCTRSTVAQTTATWLLLLLFGCTCRLRDVAAAGAEQRCQAQTVHRLLLEELEEVEEVAALGPHDLLQVGTTLCCVRMI